MKPLKKSLDSNDDFVTNGDNFRKFLEHYEKKIVNPISLEDLEAIKKNVKKRYATTIENKKKLPPLNHQSNLYKIYSKKILLKRQLMRQSTI